MASRYELANSQVRCRYFETIRRPINSRNNRDIKNRRRDVEAVDIIKSCKKYDEPTFIKGN